MFTVNANKTLNLPYIKCACERVGVCVHMYKDCL